MILNASEIYFLSYTAKNFEVDWTSAAVDATIILDNHIPRFETKVEIKEVSIFHNIMLMTACLLLEQQKLIQPIKTYLVV